MLTKSETKGARGFSARSAIAVALAMGCTALPGFALAQTNAVHGDRAQPNKKIEKQVAAAERLVSKAPQSAEARARLAQAYLAAGRFASSGTGFEDAVSLGDRSPATALGMALSYIGCGRNAEASALLGQWRETIPAGDYGLAVALAGRPDQAVQILGEAIKQGENTPKMRQNLAYAFALSGRLQEARVIASQDVPVDQIEARISDWALQASVGSQQSRVAALLGAPLRADPGQPAQLALATPGAGSPAEAMLAVNDTVAPQADKELPALNADASAPMPVMAQAEPLAAPDFAAGPDFAAAAAPAPAPGPAPQADTPVKLASVSPSGLRFVSNPVIQDISARVERRAALASVDAPQPRQPSAAALQPATARPAAAQPAPGNGSHLVQLGSFTTEAGAHRAWGIFVQRDPSLKARELRITEALVNGRRYFRVAAAGYEAAEAQAKCSSLRGRGSDCIALAGGRSSRGTLPIRAVAGRLARS